VVATRFKFAGACGLCRYKVSGFGLLISSRGFDNARFVLDLKNC
jgi:hypothetical protein